MSWLASRKGHMQASRLSLFYKGGKRGRAVPRGQVQHGILDESSEDEGMEGVVGTTEPSARAYMALAGLLMYLHDVRALNHGRLCDSAVQCLAMEQMAQHARASAHSHPCLLTRQGNTTPAPLFYLSWPHDHPCLTLRSGPAQPDAAASRLPLCADDQYRRCR